MLLVYIVTNYHTMKVLFIVGDWTVISVL